MKINTYILSTAEIEQSLVDDALGHGVEIHPMSFIEVMPVADSTLAEELERLCTLQITVVFTSANAVSAIASSLEKFQPRWTIYCIGNATKNAVLNYFDPALIKGTATDGADLAKIIKQDSISEVVFFCGDKRLDALPDFLYRNDIMVREIVVYRTKETPVQINRHYQGIMFFSPNGVNSFFRVNQVDSNTVLFAIGNTTAASIRSKSGNPIVVSDSPSRPLIVKKVLEYFHK